MVVTGPEHETCPDEETVDVPRVGNEQEVVASDDSTRHCFIGKKFESFDEMMMLIDG